MNCQWVRSIRLLGTSRAIVGGFVLVFSMCAVAQERGLSEMRIAERHAAAAANARSLEQAKAELQQALNCLVGRGDDEFRSNVGDPCKGASALRTLPNGSVNRIRVQKAIRLAIVGVTFHDFKPAQFTAQAVRAVLEECTR